MDFQRFFKLICKKDETAALAALEDQPDWARRPQTLLEACLRSKALLVERALALGADPNVRSRPTPGAWRIPLGRAVEAHDGHGRWTDGQRRIAELLVEAGGDVDGRSCFGMRTVLGLAAGAGNLDATAWLLDRGDEVDFEDAAALGQVETVRRRLRDEPGLATLGRPSGEKHFFTVTLAMDAVAGSRLGRSDPLMVESLFAVVDLLHAAGSPVDAWRHEGKTYGGPAEQAAFAGNAPVLARLIELGASPQKALAHGLHSGDARTLEVLGRFPLDYDAVENPKLGSTLLHEEIRWGRLANALWLVRRGADPNRPDGRGWTPAHYAASRGVSVAWLKELQGLGADLMSANAQGQTPLDVAEAKGKKKLVAWLREL